MPEHPGSVRSTLRGHWFTFGRHASTTDEVAGLLFRSGAVSGIVSGTVSGADVRLGGVGGNAARTSGPGCGALAGGQRNWTIYLLK